MRPASPRERRLAYFAWALVCIIWGTTYLGIRISLETIPPALMGGLRWTIAGVLLAGYVLMRGERLPSPHSWGGISLMAFLLLFLGNGGVVVAEQWVPSGLTAVLIATSPFWMAGVEALLRDGERLTRATVFGLAVGFTGILVLVWPELSLGSANSRQFLIGVVALQVASLGWSLGSAYSRRQPRNEDVLGSTALQMLAGGLMMIAAGTARGEWAELSFSLRTTTALAYLSTLGAIGGFVAYTYALRHLAVSFVSLYAYINPVIAVALGVVVLGEPFDSRMAIAAALVFAGVAIVRSRTSTADRHEPTREKADLPESVKDGSAEGKSRPRRIA
jgi:drug/metabolite transporter (DMT)-like permease